MHQTIKNLNLINKELELISSKLPSIIAVVFGGTSLAGGKGGYVGTALGAILLIILQSILITIRIDESGRQMIFGATLLLLMVFYGRGKMLRS